jgi:hypothetical protein
MVCRAKETIARDNLCFFAGCIGTAKYSQTVKTKFSWDQRCERLKLEAASEKQQNGIQHNKFHGGSEHYKHKP